MIKIAILGTRGVPARHGGFETFAEKLAPYLAEQGVEVTVYCQDVYRAGGPFIEVDSWNGVRRVHVRVLGRARYSTVLFDLISSVHATLDGSVQLVLGYNTALFQLIGRACRRRIIFNMDGIEWQRGKWGRWVRLWLRTNEKVAHRLANIAIADHPSIAAHLFARTGRQSVVIPYGAEDTRSRGDLGARRTDLADDYFLVVARCEPENSLLEIVRAFSSRPRSARLVVVSDVGAAGSYGIAVRSAADPSVTFMGAVYDPAILAKLRYHAKAYVHGHTVGGTNPSLVEALSAGRPVIAHDNRFNRWVAGDGQLYFKNEADLDSALSLLSGDNEAAHSIGELAYARYKTMFQWEAILRAYFDLLTDQEHFRQKDSPWA